MNKERKHIAVFGLGYVGLPLSLSYSLKGFTVYGIDISKKLISDLKQCITTHLESYKETSIQQILNQELSAGRFIPSETPEEAFENCDKYFITVGVPADGGLLDLSNLKSACQSLSSGLQKGDTVIIRSTVVPGTTEEILLPILEASGLKAGTDFYLCYCPERISEGTAFDDFENLEVILAGINEESTSKGKEVLKMVSGCEPRTVSSIKLAEATKIVENALRDINIAVVHQISDFCRKLGINVFELISAANTHPRIQLPEPGPGVGGHSVPKALYYLRPKAREFDADISLLELSRQINEAVPKRIASEIYGYFKDRRILPCDIKIAVLGFAMKDFSSDDRLSPVIEIINQLSKRGYEVKAYDPCIGSDYPFKVSALDDCVNMADALVIAALQPGIEYNNFNYYRTFLNPGAVIFDTRNIIDIDEAEKHDFTVFKLL